MLEKDHRSQSAVGGQICKDRLNHAPISLWLIIIFDLANVIVL
jgi:hypothetical protein